MHHPLDMKVKSPEGKDADIPINDRKMQVAKSNYQVHQYSWKPLSFINTYASTH